MITEPIASAMRPASFDDMAGQTHLVGPRGALRRMVNAGRITNMIFFGPPGTGKTTAAGIIAAASGMELRRLNATTASLSDVRDVAAETAGLLGANGILLYLDEIQYFNKKQQQSLLEYIEDGRITLIASTTENPYYYIYDALLSRCSVFEFKRVPSAETVPLLRRALSILSGQSPRTVTFTDEGLSFIAQCGGGDVRRALTLLETMYVSSDDGEAIGEAEVRAFLPEVSAGAFDRDGDVHYDLLACLQKSIRGSDADAALFYLAKLLEGGDMLSAIRRLLVIASEDVGPAYPMAAVLTYACCESAKAVGMPEACLPLANAVITLATAPKSNGATAIHAAQADVRAGRGTEIPEHLRSPFFKGYKYPHDYPNHYTPQRYMPLDLGDTKYYSYGDNKTEQAAKAYWDAIKGTFAPPDKK